MNNLDKQLHNKLKEKVERKLGKQVRHLKDCRLVRNQIYEHTNRQLSISTIKRFFGLIDSPFSPSKYTLDTFSAYLGFEDFNSYVKFLANAQYGLSQLKDIELTIQAIKEITAISVHSLSDKTGYDKASFLHREYVNRHLTDFLHSDKPATILTAPTGYGKSSALLQFYNDQYTGSESDGKNDLICLIDGSIFFSIYSQPQYHEVLRPLIEFDYKEVQELYSTAAARDNETRFVVIIDEVDRIFRGRERFHQLVGNIMQLVMINKLNKLFKLILTCNPEHIDSFASFAVQSTILESAFYNFSFRYKDPFDVINLPLFRAEELQIGVTMNLGSHNYYTLRLQFPGILELLKIPLYFNFFLQNQNNVEKMFSEVSFYNAIIQQFIVSQPFAEEKQRLINKLLEQYVYENNMDMLDKGMLLKDESHKLAYNELVNAGVLYDTIQNTNEPEIRFNIKFVNNHIFEYIFSRWYLKRKMDDPELVGSIINGYKGKINEQYALMKWLVKVSFHEKNIPLLKKIHQQLERNISISNELTGESMPGSLRWLHTIFVDCLRSNNEIAKILLPWLAKFPLGQKLYFEEYFDMDNLMSFPDESFKVYAASCRFKAGNLVAHYLKFLKGYYSFDYDSCEKEFEIISKINFSDIDKVYLKGYYLSAYYLYASIYDNKVSKELLEQVKICSEQLKMRNHHDHRFFIPFEIYIILNLNIGDFFEEVLILVDFLKKSRGRFETESSFYHQILKLCYARALLNTGSESKALKIFNQVTQVDFPFYLKHFLQLNFNLAIVDFMYYQNNTADALQLLSETKVLANLMGYSYFVRKSENLEYKILNPKNDSI